jgi:hypothetical protein
LIKHHQACCKSSAFAPGNGKSIQPTKTTMQLPIFRTISTARPSSSTEPKNTLQITTLISPF